MEKVDKEEAAAYKAREEEAKLARQRQEEKNEKNRNSSLLAIGNAANRLAEPLP